MILIASCGKAASSKIDNRDRVGTKHYVHLSIIAKALAAISCPASLLVMTLDFCARDLSSNPTRFVVVIILQ